MNPEERAKYLEYLKNTASQENYNKSIGEEQQYIDEWDYYKKQYDYSKDSFAKSTDIGLDVDKLSEAQRLGADYRVGSEFNEENLWRRQGVGEQLGNATNRFLWNTIYDTIGGTAAMVDLPGYVDPNQGIFRDVADWARRKKEETAEANPIYQKQDAGMLGPGMVAWWIENGSSLASSAASFGIQGMGIGKAMQGAKWLANINKIGKVDKLGRRGAEIATGETLAGIGKTGEQIARGQQLGDFGRNLASSTALTQSAAMMSATETYSSIYEDAVANGYGEEYAKRVAGQAASNVVNMSRANILLNMTSANRFLGGSKNIKSLKPETIKHALAKEGLQEAAEENIELIAQKQAEIESQRALASGDESRVLGSQLGFIPTPTSGLANMPLLTGNVYGDASWKEVIETSVLGALGGMAQTGVSEFTNRLGTSTGPLSKIPGAQKMFGKQDVERQATTEYYPDGTVKHYAGDPVIETEDVMVTDPDTGELVPDYIESSVEKDAEGNPVKEIRQKPKLDEKGQPVVKYKKGTFSQRELEEDAYNRQKAVLDKFTNNINKNATTIATAKYQKQLETTVSDINRFVEEGKESFTEQERDKLIDDLARIELINSGATDLDSDEDSKARLEEKRKEIAKDFDNNSEIDLRKKQDELLEFSLARTAIESFENGTKDHFKQALQDLKKLTPEQAEAAGYGEDYEVKIDDALSKIDTYYNRWMEYNTKRSGHVARALFNNRLKYDLLNEEITDLDSKATDTHNQTVKDHAIQNDVDLNEIDEDGISNKSKYNEAWKIEKEKNKKELTDSKLKQLEKDQDKLEDELQKLTFDSEAARRDPDKYSKDLEKATKAVDRNTRSINTRKKEIAKPFNERIKALGIKNFNPKTQSEIYKQKIKAVEESKKLDKQFDYLVGPDGENKLKKIQRDKAIARAKRKVFINTMFKYMKLQEEEGGVYWNGNYGHVVQENGQYLFQIDGETDFISLISEKSYYESIIKPGMEKEYQEYRREQLKKIEEELATLKTQSNNLEKTLLNNTTRRESLNKDYINLTHVESDSAVKDRIEEFTQNDKLRKEAIKNINKINKDLGRPEVSSDISADNVLKQEKVLFNQLAKEINKLDKEDAKTSETLEEQSNKTVELTEQINSGVIPVPQNMRLYTVSENVNPDSKEADGTITISQNVKSKTVAPDITGTHNYFVRSKSGKSYEKINQDKTVKKGETVYVKDKEGNISIFGTTNQTKQGKKGNKAGFKKIQIKTIEPISVPLSYENIDMTHGATKEEHEVVQAKREYNKAYVAKLVRLKQLTNERIKLYEGYSEEQNEAYKAAQETFLALQDLEKLRSFMHSNNLGRESVDHADPIANQYNKLVANLMELNQETLDQEANDFREKLDEMANDIEQFSKDIETFDKDIEQATNKMLEHESKFKSGATAKSTYKRWYKYWNNKKKEAQRKRNNLKSKINTRQTNINKYESYVLLLDNTTYDVDFVKDEINKLRLPIQQLKDDILKMNEGIDVMQIQLDTVDERIKYTRKLASELRKALKSNKKFDSNTERIDELEEVIWNLFEGVSTRFRDDSTTVEFLQSMASLGAGTSEDFDKLIDAAKNFPWYKGKSGKDIRDAIEERAKLINENDVILEKLNLTSGNNVQTLQEEYDFLRDMIRADLAQKEFYEEFIESQEDKIIAAENKANELRKIHGSTIYLLTRLDRKLTDNARESYDKLQELDNEAVQKIKDNSKKLFELQKGINNTEDELKTLVSELEILNKYKGVFDEQYVTFMQETDLDSMNQMINYINGTVDENGNNRMIDDLNAEINLINKQLEQNKLYLKKLKIANDLHTEMVAAVRSEDLEMSPGTLDARRETISMLKEEIELDQTLGVMKDIFMERDDLSPIDQLEEIETDRANELSDLYGTVNSHVNNEIDREQDISDNVVNTIDTIVPGVVREGIEGFAETIEDLKQQIQDNSDAWDEAFDNFENLTDEQKDLNAFQDLMTDFSSKNEMLTKQLANITETNTRINPEISTILPNLLTESIARFSTRRPVGIQQADIDAVNNKYDAQVVELRESFVDRGEDISPETEVIPTALQENISFEEQLTQMKDDIEMLKLIFNDQIPEVAQEIETKSEVKKGKATADELQAQKELEEGGEIIEVTPNKLTDEDPVFIRSKASIFTTVPRHLKYNITYKDGKAVAAKRVYDKNGVPILTENMDQINYMNFLNSFATNPKELTEQFDVEYVSLTEDKDGKQVVRKQYENDPFLDHQIHQEDNKGKTLPSISAQEVDKKYPGIYVLVVDKKGDRIYGKTNDDGTFEYSTEQKEGYAPLYDYLPNPDSNKFKTNMGDNMLISKLNELTGQSGKTKFNDFGDTVVLAGNTYSTGSKTKKNTLPLTSLKSFLEGQLEADMRSFRNTVNTQLSEGIKVYSPINKLSQGDLMKKDINDIVNMPSAGWLFNEDTFVEFVKTEKGKGFDTSIKLMGNDYTVISGIPYILSNDGSLVPVYSKKLGKKDQQLVLKLITEAFPTTVEAASRQGTYQVIGGKEKKVNLMTVGDGPNNIGLLNKVINWSQGDKKTPFNIWVENGQIIFITKEGKKRYIPIKSIEEYLTTNKVDSITDSNGKKYFNDLLDFLSEKRKHVHYGLIDNSNIKGEYLHPELNDKGEVVLKSYPKGEGYMKYLSGTLVTDVVKPIELPKGANSIMVGKYLTLNTKKLRSEAGTDIKVNRLTINNVPVINGSKLKKDNVIDFVKWDGNNLTWQGEILTSDNIKSYSFPVEKPILTKTEENVVPLSSTTIPVLTDDTIFISNGQAMEGVPYGLQIEIKKFPGTDVILMRELLGSSDGTLYGDVYEFDENGNKELLDLDEGREGLTKQQIKNIQDIKLAMGIDKSINPSSLLNNEGREKALGRKIESISDYIELVNSSTAVDSNIKNALKLSEVISDGYIPYLITGKNNEWSNKILLGKDNILTINGHPTSLKAQVKLETEKPSTVKEILKDKTFIPSSNNVYSRLIKSLLGKDDVDIKYMPHIIPDAKFDGKAIHLSLGSIVRSNLKGKNLAATIAHELVHRLDKNTKKTGKEWNRLKDIRNNLIKYLYEKNPSILSKELNYNGKNISALGYWLFNKKDISAKDFMSKLKESNGNVDKLMADLEVDTLNDVDMTEFFANVMNQKEYQEFLNSVKAKDIGISNSDKSVFQEFLKIFSDLLKRLINVSLDDESVLAEILNTGAAHYKKQGGIFKDVKGEVVFDAAPTDTKSTITTKTKESTKVDEISNKVEEAKKDGNFVKAAELQLELNKLSQETGETPPDNPTAQPKVEVKNELGINLGDINLSSDKPVDVAREELLDVLRPKMKYLKLSLNQMMKVSKEVNNTVDLDKLSKWKGSPVDTINEILDTKFIDDIPFSLSLSEQNDPVRESKFNEMWYSADYDEAFKEFLDPQEYLDFLIDIANEKEYEELRKTLDHEEAESRFILELMDTVTVNRKQDGSFDSIETPYKSFEETLTKLFDYIISRQHTKPSTMSKQRRKVSSKYEFKNATLTHLEMNSVMDGMTHYLFDYLRDKDADAFFATKLNEKLIYDEIRKGLTEQTSQILSVFKAIQDGKNLNEQFGHLNTQGYKIGLDMAKDLSELQKLESQLGVDTSVKQAEIFTRLNSIIKLNNKFFDNTEDNLDDFKELIRMHVNKMRGLGFELSEEFIDRIKVEEELDSVKDTPFNLDPHEIDPKNSIPNAIKLLIASQVNQYINNDMTSQTGQEVFELKNNYLGLPQPNEFSEVYNMLVKKLANLPADRTIMMSKLLNEFNSNKSKYNKASVLKGLVDPDSIINNIGTADNPNYNASINDIRLATQFIQVFSKFTPKFFLARVDNNGTIHFVDGNKHRASEQLIMKWGESFQRTLVEKGGETVFDIEMGSKFKANIKEAEETYKTNPTKAFNMLRAELNKIGMEVVDLERVNAKIMKSSKDPKKPSTIFSKLIAKGSIADAVTKASTEKIEGSTGNLAYNPFKDDTISGTMKDLAEIVVDVSNQVVDNQFISVDNKTIYAATLNHMLSISSNKINHASNTIQQAIKEVLSDSKLSLKAREEALEAIMNGDNELRRTIPHLFNVFTKNSVGLDMIKHGEVDIEVGIFNGMVVAGQVDGTTTKELDSPDKWAKKIAATMEGIYTFYRAADRGTENFFVFRDKTSGAVKKLYNTRDEALTSYFGYLEDEINSMIQHKKGVGADVKFYNKKGSQFRFFNDDKISNEIKDKILTAIDQGQSLEYIRENIIDKNKDQIENEITEYFRRKGQETKRKIKQDGLLDVGFTRWKEEVYDGKKVTTVVKPDAKKGYLYFKGLSAEILKNSPHMVDINIGVNTSPFDKSLADKMDKVIDEILLDFNMFQTGAYIEQSKLITGDPAMYSNSDDFFKRMAMLNSTKKASVQDATLDKIMNENNHIKIMNGDTPVEYTLSKSDIRNLLTTGKGKKRKFDNTLDINRLTKTTKDKIKALIGDTKLSDLSLVPDIGFNPDYLLGDNSYNGYVDSIILEDIGAQSVLATDNVDRIDIRNNEIVYLDKDGKVLSFEGNGIVENGVIPPVSLLRRLFAQSFYNDGITNPALLDTKVKSYMNPYLGMDENDAQAYATLSAYKEILVRSSDWTDGHEIAYQKMIIGEELDPAEVFLFRVLKTQYSGPLALNESNYSNLNNDSSVLSENENSNLFIPTGYKHSVMPLIPQLIKGTNLEKLNNVMVMNGVGLAHMTSANKFGRKVKEDDTTNTVYDENGKFNITSDNLIKQTTSFDYLGVQLDQSPKMKGKITTSTQFRKLALSNLIEFGVPVDFEGSRDDWYNMTEPDKVASSELYSIYKDYQDVQRELFKRPFDSLADEIDLRPVVNNANQITGYVIGNRDKLVDVIMEQALDRGASENLKSSIESLLSPESYMEHVLNRDKVENVLFAIVNSRVVREKRKGEGAPQVAVSMLEGIDVAREGVAGNRFSSKELRHYIQGANGKVLPAHCMIGLPKEWLPWINSEYGGLDGFNTYLDGVHAKLEDIEVSGNGTIEASLTDEERNILNLITTIGFRIPNQGLQSSDYMRVRKFLPTSVGDSIVVPTEMVAKAGSDFDIDKLNMYYANYKKPKQRKDGTWIQPTYYKFLDNSNSTLRERHQQYLDGVKMPLDDETAAYIDDVYEYREGDYEALREGRKEFDKEQYDRIKAEYNSAKNEIFNQSKTKSKGDLDILANFSLSAFNTLDDDLRLAFINENRGMEGDFIEKTIQFKGLAETYLNLFEANVDENTNDTSGLMIADPRGEIEEGVPVLILNEIENLKHLIDTYDSIIKYTGGKKLLEYINDQTKELYDWEKEALPKIKESKSQSLASVQEQFTEVQNDYKDMIDSTIRQYKIDNGAISENEFAQLNSAQQNSDKSLQNRMIELHADIMSHPYNYRQLMAPIDDTITKDQAWSLRSLNTYEGIKYLQGRHHVRNDDGEWEYSDSGLQQDRINKLQEVIGDHHALNTVQSIVTETGKFIPAEDLLIGTDGSIEYNNKPVHLQQVNLTSEGQMQFMLAMAPIYTEKFNKWKNDENKRRKNKNISSIADPNVNIDKFIEFLSGKAGVGQTAVHITHHQLAMAANMSYNVGEDGSYWIFDHSLDQDGNPSFARKLDQNGEWISETLSAFVNAYVDIAKDPYVFDMNAGNRTANMMLMMVRAGASIPWITKFISQPIIKDYIQAQRKNESMINKAAGMEVSKARLVKQLLEDYDIELIPGPNGEMFETPLIYMFNEDADREIEKLYNLKKQEGDPAGIIQDMVKTVYDTAREGIEQTNRWERIKELRNNGMFTEEKLSQYILHSSLPEIARQSLMESDPNHSYLENDDIFMENLEDILTMDLGITTDPFYFENPNVYSEVQASILDMFLEYQRQSKDFQMMIRATSADTKGAQKNLSDNQIFLDEIGFVQFKNRFTNVDKILSESVVSQVHQVVEESINAFKSLYYFEKNPKIRYVRTTLQNLIESSNSLNADRRSKLYQDIQDDLTTAIVTAEYSKDVPNIYNPKVVFEELFIKSDKNNYINSKGEKAPLSEILFELNSKKVDIDSLMNQWQNGELANKPSVIDLEALRDNAAVKELLGRKPRKSYKDYNEFKTKLSIGSLPEFYTIESQSRKMDITKTDDIRAAFLEIKDLSPRIYLDLIRVAINQSGIHHNSPITYSKLIPQEDINEVLTSSFETFDNLTDEDQKKLLEQFQNQFLERSIVYTPNVKSAKFKSKKGQTMYGIFDQDDARLKHPHLVRTKFDKKTGTYRTEAIKGQVGKDGKAVWFHDWVNSGFSSYTRLKSGNSPIRGYKRFFMGYDLSLSDDTNQTKDVIREEKVVPETKTVIPTEMTKPNTYTGFVNVNKLQPNQVFVFGANSVGGHGGGTAGLAQFGKKTMSYNVPKVKKGVLTVYGKTGLMEGTKGMSYGLITKKASIKGNKLKIGGKKSVSQKDITSNIEKLYEVAKNTPDKEFLIGYADGKATKKGMNGYTMQEMANMFSSAGPIPNNVIFNENFYKLIKENTTKQPSQDPSLPSEDPYANIPFPEDEYSLSIMEDNAEQMMKQALEDAKDAPCNGGKKKK